MLSVCSSLSLHSQYSEAHNDMSKNTIFLCTSQAGGRMQGAESQGFPRFLSFYVAFPLPPVGAQSSLFPPVLSIWVSAHPLEVLVFANSRTLE